VLFADRHRAWVLSALGAALIVFAAGSVLHPGVRPPAQRCWVDPVVCAGETLALPLVRVRVAPDGTATLRSGTATLNGRGPGLVDGAILTVEGTFADDGTFVVAASRAHPWRVHKGLFGVVGAIALAVLLAVVFRVRRTPEGWRVVPSAVVDA
jgi:hypothetical protein